MKILRITTSLDFGGQEQQFISFASAREMLKNEYVFAAIGYGGHAEKALVNRGFKVHILNRKVSVKSFGNILALYKLIKAEKPDVVHTAAAEANFHGIIAARLAGVKYLIAEEIGIPSHSSLAQKIFAVVYRWCDKVICVSQSVKDHLVRTDEISDEKGVVIYNPVCFPNRYELERTKKFNIVYVGRLEKIKNVKSLICAFSQMEHDHLQLIVVGHGSERNSLEDLVKNLNLSGKVKFEGFQPDPGKYLSTADLFVLPSYSEGFGIGAVEAMFLQVPVLCSNVGGIPEFVEDNVNGWLFDPNDADNLHLKLEKILSLNDQDRKQMGINGYRSVFNSFTVEKYIKRLENLYEQVCKK